MFLPGQKLSIYFHAFLTGNHLRRLLFYWNILNAIGHNNAPPNTTTETETEADGRVEHPHPPRLPPTPPHDWHLPVCRSGQRRSAPANEYHIKLVSDGCEQLFSYILNEEFNYGQHKFNDKSNDRHHRKGCYSRKIAEDHHSKCQMKWFFKGWAPPHHLPMTVMAICLSTIHSH